MFDNPYMDANTMTALALKPINVQPNSRYNLKIDIENGNFGANDSLFYTIAILNGNEYAEQGFTATVLTEQATENIIEPADLFNTHTLSFTTDAATNNIVLQVFMMLNDSTQNNLYFTIDNVTLEEVNGGKIYTINPHSSLNKYRFGFNGAENLNEVKGYGNSYDFGARIYDSRLGRWYTPDNIIKANLSSYQFGRNNPIIYVDLDGNDEYLFHSDGTWSVNRQSGADVFLRQDADDGTYKQIGIDKNFTKIIKEGSFSEYLTWRDDIGFLYEQFGKDKLLRKDLKNNIESDADKAVYNQIKWGSIGSVFSDAAGDVSDIASFGTKAAAKQGISKAIDHSDEVVIYGKKVVHKFKSVKDIPSHIKRGIYKIVFKDDEVYVGKTKRAFTKRISEHFGKNGKFNNLKDNVKEIIIKPLKGGKLGTSEQKMLNDAVQEGKKIKNIVKANSKTAKY